MAEKRPSLKTALRDLAGGAAIGGAIALAAAIRDMARRRHPAAAPGRAAQVGGGAIASDAAADLATGEPAENAAERPRAPLQLRPGWQAVEREALPRPTYWPAALAFALVLVAWGIATTYLISIIGAILLAISLAGWIGELLHDH